MIYKIISFMRGRYGRDELYKFLLYLYLVLLILNIFINSKIILILELIIILIMVYRYLSKDINRRRRENELFLDIKIRIREIFKGTSKDYVYKKCHKCKKILRLPVPDKRGLKTVRCPICKNKNRFIVLDKVKVEVIKKKK